MYCTRKLTENILWVGGNDHRLALFENLFPIPDGVSYNSYLIQDEKTALMDTVDGSMSQQLLENVAYGLQGKNLDYLIINHMEPDHCGAIESILLRYPEVTLVGNTKTFTMLDQFYHLDVKDRSLVVKDGDSLSLGEHTLTFYATPMVHWPEVMMSYESKEKILFSADAFGSFGALNGHLFADELDIGKGWLAEARRYYSNIVGKYGPQVQATLKKLSALDIATICPLHGPVWRENLDYLLSKHDLWSRYQPEEKSVVICYGSMYGGTEAAANLMATGLAEGGARSIAMYDVSTTHISVVIGEIFRCSHVVLAAPTYNNNIYPAMDSLIQDMKALNIQNRYIALLDNGTWAPTCAKQMVTEVQSLKNITLLEPVVTVKSSVKQDSLEQMKQLQESILSTLL